MTKEELIQVLEMHKHYLKQDCYGWENMKANLHGADLSCADLSYADLSYADLVDAVLYGANLCDSNLSCAKLRDADLSDANLSGADLHFANLGGTNLRGANLVGANIGGADLSDANLSGADIRCANLRGADLRGADIRNVKYNEETAFFALSCPEEGDFIGWKKVFGVIVKLRIPAEAKRSSATSRKCRCEFAEVLELQNLDGTPYDKSEIVNASYIRTIYKVGEIVRPDSWDENRWNECSHGIHFFTTRDEAVNY